MTDKNLEYALDGIQKFSKYFKTLAINQQETDKKVDSIIKTIKVLEDKVKYIEGEGIKDIENRLTLVEGKVSPINDDEETDRNMKYRLLEKQIKDNDYKTKKLDVEIKMIETRIKDLAKVEDMEDKIHEVKNIIEEKKKEENCNEKEEYKGNKCSL